MTSVKFLGFGIKQKTRRTDKFRIAAGDMPDIVYAVDERLVELLIFHPHMLYMPGRLGAVQSQHLALCVGNAHDVFAGLGTPSVAVARLHEENPLDAVLHVVARQLLKNRKRGIIIGAQARAIVECEQKTHFYRKRRGGRCGAQRLTAATQQQTGQQQKPHA